MAVCAYAGKTPKENAQGAGEAQGTREKDTREAGSSASARPAEHTTERTAAAGAPWNEGWRALPRDRRARSRGMVDRRTPPGLPGSSVCSRGGGERPHPNQPSCAQTAPQRSPPHVYGVVASLPRRGGGTETPRRLHGGSRAIPSARPRPSHAAEHCARPRGPLSPIAAQEAGKRPPWRGPRHSLGARDPAISSPARVC